MPFRPVVDNPCRPTAARCRSLPRQKALDGLYKPFITILVTKLRTQMLPSSSFFRQHIRLRVRPNPVTAAAGAVFAATALVLASSPSCYCQAFISPSPSRCSIFNARRSLRMFSSSNDNDSVHSVGGLRDIAHHYDVFLIDQWGVMHDGYNAYPQAVACMEQLLALGKHVILLSNSSKRKAGSLVRLVEMGFTPDKYLDVVTSGELTFLGLSPPRTSSPYTKIQGRRVLVFGSGDDDRDYVQSMGCRIASLEEADFLLARGPFIILESSDPSIPPLRFGPGRILHESAEFDALATKAVERGLPMIVSNPDIVRPGGDNDPMPGMIGQAYEKKGGRVIYVGKPYPLVYAHCRELMEEVVGKEGGLSELKMCAIGDSMWNDIKGAVDQEIASILVTDGIHAQALGVEQGSGKTVREKALNRFWEGFSFKPTHTVPCFRW